MIITDFFDEIARDISFLKVCFCSDRQEEIRNIIFRNFSEKVSVGKNNNNFASFNSYYRKLFSGCLKICKTSKDESLVDYFYFFLQNFLSHTLPSHLAYIKVYHLSEIDLIAPLADITGSTIYFIDDKIANHQYSNSLLDLSNKSQNIFSSSLSPHNLMYSSLESYITQSHLLNHKVGGLSIILNDIEEAIQIIKLVLIKITDFCDVLVVGHSKAIETLKITLELCSIKTRKFKVMFLGHSQYGDIDSIAYFILEKN